MGFVEYTYMTEYNYVACGYYLLIINASIPSIEMAFWNNPITHCVMIMKQNLYPSMHVSYGAQNLKSSDSGGATR